ncbi:ABC transporter ATP-binding protein [Pseudonocardia nigra]|uniref:ABC transporter ATP-binding protein n=1 Tax=Pseudonocardia nigra TaxID=1921578 RepID=UPI001C5F4E1F|nr:ABC transporter ATP-binding protein [Pseudonocardia nigra]
MGADERSTGLEDVTVTFGGGPPALCGVTLLAAPGEVLAVVGPSGSGKTTALRAVAGLEPVRGGRVLVAGRDVTRVPTPQRELGMVFRAATLLPFLDVAANLTRAASAPSPGPGAGRRVAERSRRLGLGRLLQRMPRTLSAGETTLAGIGRALVRAPAAFLFDDPLAHLDAVERVRARRTIVSVVREAGVGALYVAADPVEAMAVADRIAVLRDGQVVQVDRPRRLYDRPVDAFVAGFLGGRELGLLPARLVAAAGGAGFRIGARTLPLWGPVPAALTGRVGDTVLLGLRAEDVGEARPGADPGSVTLPVSVRRVEPAGHDAVVTAEVDLPGEADGARLYARADAATRLRAGERAELVVDARRAHVFDPATRRALHHPA